VEDDPYTLHSHYGRSKLINELMAASFPDTLGLRIFNAYGRGDELKTHCSPIQHMVVAKLTSIPFLCYHDGTQAKDFIHVSDVAEIIMRLVESPATGIVNVGTGTATSFNNLAKLIGVPVEYAPVPDPASYQYFTRADTTRLLSLIGDYKFLSLEEGLKLL
jgi:UDP-glucose 4-epimerase